MAHQFQIFVTPLALELTQRIMEQTAAAFLAIHPAFIVQHLYTVCSLRHHSQPLTELSSNESGEINLTYLARFSSFSNKCSEF